MCKIELKDVAERIPFHDRLLVRFQIKLENQEKLMTFCFEMEHDGTLKSSNQRVCQQNWKGLTVDKPAQKRRIPEPIGNDDNLFIVARAKATVKAQKKLHRRKSKRYKQTHQLKNFSKKPTLKGILADAI